jgi:hypothetical protein
MPAYGWGLVLLAIYVLLVILARWIYIARTNVLWTSAQAKAMTRRLTLQGRSGCPGNGKAPVPQAALQPLLAEIKNHNPKSNSSGIIGWNGSHQIAQWVLMHEAERLALPTLRHPQLVARLERAQGQLKELPQHRREAWEPVIRALLARKDEPDRERLDHEYRAYLDEVLGEIYEASNGNAIQLSGLYNRATWIILVALLPLTVLAAFGFGTLLVAGAIGGLISRMHRLVFSTRIPVTYGSSWGPLFCAPVLGALAAWAGLVLISLLQTAGVLQLTALQTSLDDLRAPSAAVLGIAILLGASERFLLRLEKQAEAVIDPDHVGPADQAATARTTTAAQRVPGLRTVASPTTAAASAAAANGDATANGDAAKTDAQSPEGDSARQALGLTGS